MSYTQEDIDRLKASMAKGISKARIGDEEVNFRSLAEMQAQLNRMIAEVSPASNSRSVYPVFVARPQ